MTPRDLHPGDIVLIYGVPARIERVDRTHLATRRENDSLDLWSYQGEIEPLPIYDELAMKSVGFYKTSEGLNFRTGLGHVLVKNNLCKIQYGDGYAEKEVKSLSDVQQFYYEVIGLELKGLTV